MLTLIGDFSVGTGHARARYCPPGNNKINARKGPMPDITKYAHAH